MRRLGIKRISRGSERHRPPHRGGQLLNRRAIRSPPRSRKRTLGQDGNDVGAQTCAEAKLGRFDNRAGKYVMPPSTAKSLARTTEEEHAKEWVAASARIGERFGSQGPALAPQDTLYRAPAIDRNTGLL